MKLGAVTAVFGISAIVGGLAGPVEAQSYRVSGPYVSIKPLSQMSSSSGQTRQARDSANERLMRFLRDIRSNENRVPLKALNNQILAESSSAPLTIIQRIQVAALAMHQAAYQNGRDVGGKQYLEIPGAELCNLMNATARHQNSVFYGDDAVLARELFMGRRGCGSGELKNVAIQLEGQMSYLVNIRLEGKLKATGSHRIFTTQGRNILSVIGERTYQESTLNLIDRVLSDSSRNSRLQNLFRSDYLSYDVEAGLYAMRDAVRNEADPMQPRRVLANYPTLVFTRYTEETALRVAPRSQFWSKDTSAMQILMYSTPLSWHGSRVMDGHSRFVLSFDQGASQSSSDIQIASGRVRLVPSPIQVTREWNTVAHYTLTSAYAQIEEHLRGIKVNGIGTMYGPASYFAGFDEEQQAAYIASHKKVSGEIPTPEKTSCIGFVLKHLEQGYAAASKQARWQEIDTIVRENRGQGTYLLRELQNDGWRLIYFNPDKLNPTERVENRSKEADHHLWTWYLARDSKGYMTGVTSYGRKFEGLKLDYVATDYRVTDPEVTEHNSAAARLLQEIPFFVGIANGGYHVYFGSKGMVVESHSTRGPRDQTNIEVRPFNQWGLFNKESFLSGVIAVPPGDWELGMTGRFVQ